MKLLRTIAIVCVVVVGVFIFRYQIKTAYTDAASYIQKDIAPLFTKKGEIAPIQTAISQIEEIIPSSLSKSVATPVKTTPVVVTPTPLQSAENFITSQSSGTLTKEGVITLTNENRAENGNLGALTENAKLDQSAAIKLQDMFNKQYFEHVSPSGVGITNLAQEVGYQYIVIGENLALGNFGSDKALVDAWMASPGHRANILNPRYTEIGVAVGQGMYQGNLTWLAVQHFGMPQSACPTIDESLHASIVAAQADLKNREADLATRKQIIDSGDTYQGMTHDQQVDKYNELVGEYNQLVADTKAKISTYNTEVAQYNACLGPSSTSVSE